MVWNKFSLLRNTLSTQSQWVKSTGARNKMSQSNRKEIIHMHFRQRKGRENASELLVLVAHWLNNMATFKANHQAMLDTHNPEHVHCLCLNSPKASYFLIERIPDSFLKVIWKILFLIDAFDSPLCWTCPYDFWTAQNILLCALMISVVGIQTRLWIQRRMRRRQVWMLRVSGIKAYWFFAFYSNHAESSDHAFVRHPIIFMPSHFPGLWPKRRFFNKYKRRYFAD